MQLKTQTGNRTGVDKLLYTSYWKVPPESKVLAHHLFFEISTLCLVFSQVKMPLEVLKFILKEDEDSDKLQNQVSLERLHDFHTHFLVLNNLGLLLPDKLN